MNAKDKTTLQWEHDYLLHQVKKICLRCTDPRKARATLDYDNPLNCGCRCERIDVILYRARKLDNKIRKPVHGSS